MLINYVSKTYTSACLEDHRHNHNMFDKKNYATSWTQLTTLFNMYDLGVVSVLVFEP